MFRREGRKDGEKKEEAFTLHSAPYTDFPEIGSVKGGRSDRLNQDASLSRRFVRCWSVDRGSKDKICFNFSDVQGMFEFTDHEHERFHESFAASAIPLFRCLADADSGICAALAFGKRARRGKTIVEPPALRSEIISHVAQQLRTFLGRMDPT